MSLFAKKKQPKKQPEQVVDEVYTEQYRESLRQQGREYFQHILESNATSITKDIDAMMVQLGGSLKRHLASQLDLTIRRVNTDISNGIKEQLTEYNRVSSDAQNLVTQSLSRNAESVHEKYQQMATNLQQVVANQETAMVTVFQDNQSRVAAMQEEQEKTFEQLRQSIAETQRQSDELRQAMKRDADEQSEQLRSLYSENEGKTAELKQAQAAAIASLQQTVASLEAQQTQLQRLITDAIARQKSLATELINENMARIVEHYLVGALGERSSLVKDLPTILEKMDESKRDMMDDMQR